MRACRPLEDRFWPKVDRRGPDQCWLWTAGKAGKGYGVIGIGRKPEKRQVYAHRLSRELANRAEVPTGLVVMHSCDTPACVNPAHLSLGTVSENNRDCVAKGRNAFALRTHCPRGHEYTAENTYLRNGKHRVCRTCGRAATARWARGEQS